MRNILAFVFILCFLGLIAPTSSRVHCKRCLKVLNSDIKTAAKKSLTAVVQAGLDLTKIRDQFGQEQASLETNLKKARELTKLINEKIKKAVKETAEILEEATKRAKEKMQEVTAASNALGDIEEKVGVKKVQDKAKKIRNHIAKKDDAGVQNKLQKLVLDENGVIATLDAAKILAKAKVDAKEKNMKQAEAIVRNDVQKIKSDMSSAEKQLDKEQQVELEDEKEARSKIQEAVKHNQIAINKAKGFLKSIEEGLQKFHSDIKEVPINL
ncbi:uncharacterized protein LOC116301102 [Actinia tenebrosa]|uniref:Uncharacterized protein LOC116301102 n=1 Tax=Actinia tenebrosa TaxID=6105 RepID=A0A6P8IGU6_ACTTE|nr:uncharacterized protein LOC116301102 [Actinia tenebrosa]